MTLANAVFLIFPVFCWYSVQTIDMLRELTKLRTWLWIAGIELLVSNISSYILLFIYTYKHTDISLQQVLSFFNRIVLSGLLLSLLIYECIILKGIITLNQFDNLTDIHYFFFTFNSDKKERLEPFFKWGLNCAVLCIYPALPLVDKDSNHFMIL